MSGGQQLVHACIIVTLSQASRIHVRNVIFCLLEMGLEKNIFAQRNFYIFLNSWPKHKVWVTNNFACNGKLPGGKKFSFEISPLSVGVPQRRPLNLAKKLQFISSPGVRIF